MLTILLNPYNYPVNVPEKRSKLESAGHGFSNGKIVVNSVFCNNITSKQPLSWGLEVGQKVSQLG